MSINLADARPGETFMGSMGHNLNYNNMCFAENEERSVWEPFHVPQGLQEGREHGQRLPGLELHQQHGRRGLRPSGPGGDAHHHAGLPLPAGAITLVMDPLTAAHLREQGFENPDQLSKYLSENFQMPAGQFWGADVVYSLVEPFARSGMEPLATWLKAPRDEMIKPYHDPKGINIVVVGGETQAMWLTTDMWLNKTASVDKWRPAGGTFQEDPQTVRRREARQKRHASALTRSGYDL